MLRQGDPLNRRLGPTSGSRRGQGIVRCRQEPAASVANSNDRVVGELHEFGTMLEFGYWTEGKALVDAAEYFFVQLLGASEGDRSE